MRSSGLGRGHRRVQARHQAVSGVKATEARAEAAEKRVRNAEEKIGEMQGIYNKGVAQGRYLEHKVLRERRKRNLAKMAAAKDGPAPAAPGVEHER